jgi:hypothetical protein
MAPAPKPGGEARPLPQIRGPGKNLLIPDRFSSMIYGEFLPEEVILVHRSLFFTPLKS